MKIFAWAGVLLVFFPILVGLSMFVEWLWKKYKENPKQTAWSVFYWLLGALIGIWGAWAIDYLLEM